MIAADEDNGVSGDDNCNCVVKTKKLIEQKRQYNSSTYDDVNGDGGYGNNKTIGQTWCVLCS